MCKKLMLLVFVFGMLSLWGDVQAQTEMIWTDTTGDHLWSTPANWEIGTLPVSDNAAAGKVRIQVVPGPTIANEGAVAFNIRIGNNATGVLTVDGGTLAVVGWISMGRNANGVATLNMISGSIETGSLNIGEVASLATLNMTGGTITVGGYFKVGTGGATAHVNLHGGTITTGDFVMGQDAGSVGTMNITAGTLIIDGDKLSLVQGYIDDPNGWITAYGGQGTLQLDYDVTNAGKTTLKAVHMLDPSPVDGGIVAPGAVELSWTLPDPCVPGQPVPVDVYLTDDLQALEQFLDPAAIRVVTKQVATSVIVQTRPKTQYYWAVDTYIGDPNDPILGPIFSFLADNAPPSVNAGPDISTFLQDGTRTGPLNGIVTDDGAIQPYTVRWSIVEQPSDADSALPGAVIADPTAEQTTVTVSAEGTYVLQLEADDGEYTASDTMTIVVHPDDWR